MTTKSLRHCFKVVCESWSVPGFSVIFPFWRKRQLTQESTRTPETEGEKMVQIPNLLWTLRRGIWTKWKSQKSWVLTSFCPIPNLDSKNDSQFMSIFFIWHINKNKNKNWKTNKPNYISLLFFFFLKPLGANLASIPPSWQMENELLKILLQHLGGSVATQPLGSLSSY